MLNRLIIYIFLAEFIILIFIISSIIIKRINLYFYDKRKKTAQEKIAAILISCLENKDCDIDILSPYQEFLLTNLEAFDSRLKGDPWDSLKNKISQRYLLQKARKWARSWSWIKRNFAARCFALTPLIEDQRTIIKLIDDKVFLVRSIASLAALKLELKEGIFKILKHISLEPGYARCYYCDVLIQGTNKVFQYIEDIALCTNNSSIHLACLEVLACKTIEVNKEILEKDLNSSDLEIRRAAIRVLAFNPQIYSEEILIHSLDDADELIQSDAAFGLRFFDTERSIQKLEQALANDSWQVRTQAAKALKSMGHIDKLSKQQNKNAYEAAQYVLHFS